MSKKRNEPYAAIKKPVDLLFGSSAAPAQPENQFSPNTIAISQIELPASQPRRYFDPQKLEELSASIKELGILEPLLVRPLPKNKYELVFTSFHPRISSFYYPPCFDRDKTCFTFFFFLKFGWFR